MKNIRVSFCTVTLIVAFLHPASIPRLHAELLDKDSTVALLTSGPWKISGDLKGWSRIRIFKTNEVFTTEGFSDEHGHWRIENDTIILTFADRHKDTISLPLNPKGTTGASDSQEPLTCVMLNPPAGNSPAAPFSTPASFSTPVVEMSQREKAAITALLVAAPWDIKGGWYSTSRVFAPDGTFTTPGNAGEYGTWTISNNMVILLFVGGHKDTLLLPLDPKGTKGTDRHGSPTTATQQPPGDPNSAPIPAPTPELTQESQPQTTTPAPAMTPAQPAAGASQATPPIRTSVFGNSAPNQ